MKGTMYVGALVLALAILPGSPALASDYDAVRAKLEKAMSSDIRTPAETERDSIASRGRPWSSLAGAMI